MNIDPNLQASYAAAAELIDAADALILCAGAGMGIDSGLPDFRGAGGFWNAYPALGRARIHFEDIASPDAFRDDPSLAWGFYGHRLKLYRETVPHAGFTLLKNIADRMPLGSFVFTSNVDGQFQRAGFSEQCIVECHGSIHFLQCLRHCKDALWSADDFFPEIDEDSGRLINSPPLCPHCGALARPAILMFGDYGWEDRRERIQSAWFSTWRRQIDYPVVIELGAGTAIPSVRIFSHNQHCPVIRVNPTDWHVPLNDGVGLPVGALTGIKGICKALGLRSNANRE